MITNQRQKRMRQVASGENSKIKWDLPTTLFKEFIMIISKPSASTTSYMVTPEGNVITRDEFIHSSI